MSPAAWKGHLPHGVEEKTTPDGRTFWVDHRPGKPTWEDPRSHSSDPLPPGVEQHITPDGVPFFINRNPRVTWSDPRTSARPAQAPARKDSSAHFTEKAGKDIYEDEKEDLVLPQACPMPAVADAEHVLLMRMTRWRMSQVLSGYPDGRTDDVDTIISLLSTRLNIPGASTMDTMDESCIDLCYNLISSEPTLDYSMIPPRGRKISRGKNVPGPHGIWAIICPWIYLFLLGIPRNYQWRLSKADWVQVAGHPASGGLNNAIPSVLS
ncbi:hypothetical protein BOTBODRAFT_29236 [Botryobasidium botryosum FD-172 SS1]|uniref:WW domain-containing protein n=1 Tax=Botryobasidium botryosum (strain FD-172 SS1) TaxID=930990 RepID=A0A067MQT0_BOTB1|nr:hypothetical protein BOTBODRAFT_29236 [Botryobasidium botryosum FD-172 SS1]